MDFLKQDQQNHQEEGDEISDQFSQLQDQTSGPPRSSMNFMNTSELQLMELSSKSSEENGCYINTDQIKEHMFDKVVTPSDVGKLNRLVIPKQYAERYFPLDSSKNEKGLLLNFEDRNGKRWRFRYSYWNSSQSYVMTKGWSRFVKDKKLNAGDTVSFQRDVGGSGKEYHMYIDWRRRPVVLQTYNNLNPTFRPLQFQTDQQQHYFNDQSVSWGSHYDNRFYSLPISMSHQQHIQYLNFNPPNQYPNYNPHEHLQQYQQRGGLQNWPVLVENVGVVGDGKSSTTSTSSPNSSKRLRLFGVDMDYSCPTEEEEEDPDVKITMASPIASPTDEFYSRKGKSTSLPFQLDS